MAEPLKHMYNPAFIDDLSSRFSAVYPKFDSRKFKDSVFSDGWEAKELKERMRHISLTLNTVLPQNFPKAVKILEKITGDLNKEGFELMILPDYVEVFGGNHWNESISALETFTEIASSEFAVRPLILENPAKMMKVMLKWSKHKNPHVRRLASEGCRPRLPWAMALPIFKNDPSMVIPILENLKSDPELFVRRSVANNLNDISKDNPDIVIKLAKQWKGESHEVDWVIKHAFRTLLKKGEPKALKMFGYGNSSNIKIENLKLKSKKVYIGKELIFSFDAALTSRKKEKVRLEYAIYYMKKNGRQSRKVFKIGEIALSAKKVSFIKKQSFKEMTTRKHYPGKHKIAIIANGKEYPPIDFLVIR